MEGSFLRSNTEINNQKLNEQVYTILRDKIINNELPPGTKLSVENLSKQFNISRSPVSSALLALERDGFVTVYPQRGTIVRGLSIEELKLVYKLRCETEKIAISFCINKLDESKLEELKNSFQKCYKKQESTLEDLFTADIRFHDYIASFLPDIIKNQYVNLCNLTKRSRILVLEKEKNKHNDASSTLTSASIHIEILNALIEKNENKALTLIIEDIMSTLDDVLALDPSLLV